MYQLPDEIILIISKYLSIKDAYNLKKVNHLYNSLIDINNHKSYQAELYLKSEEIFSTENFQIHQDTKLIFSDNKKIFRYKNYHSPCAIDIIKIQEKFLIKIFINNKPYHSFEIQEKFFRLFIHECWSYPEIYVYTKNKFILYKIDAEYNIFDSFQFENDIKIIYKFYKGLNDAYYIFTENELKVIIYDKADPQWILYKEDEIIAYVEDYKLVRKLNPNLYLYSQNESKYLIISRYKDNFYTLINYDNSFMYSEIEGFQYYIDYYKHKIMSAIETNNKCLKFQIACRNITIEQYEYNSK